jgi:hypothetical protein
LSIPHLITAQLEQLGVPKDAITHDGIDTISDPGNHGGYKWYSASRGEKERNHVLLLIPHR